VVTEATITLLKPYLDKTLTITADNGKEFAGHETMAIELGMKIK
jgi:transposase, IS30 family